MADIAKTARFWDQVDRAKPRQFWDLPVVKAHRCRLVTGDEHTGYLEWFARFCKTSQARRGISLGCGAGHMERKAIALGLAREMVGIDISPGRLRRARELCKGLPIQYRQQDLNCIRLEPSLYDLTICRTILHHIENLEHVLSQLQAALKPGSLVFVSEYVGASRFQFPEQMLRIADEVLRVIPPELRLMRSAPGQVKEHINRIDADKLASIDPSEAARSQEIDCLLKKHFSVVAERGSGGALLFRLLDGICHNFDDHNKSHNRVLKALCDCEEQLAANGILPDIFKVYVLKNW